jgi:lambda family phage portal protein
MSSRVLKQFLQSQPGGYEQAATRAGVLPSAQIIPMPAGQRRNYAAAQINRLTEGWTTQSLSANASLHGNIDTLRARSRQLHRDNDYAKKFMALVATNVVGPHGFALEARIYDDNGDPDKAANDAVEASYQSWARKGVCEITGKHSLRDVCQMLIKAAERDGEAMLRIIRGSAAGNAFGLAVQVLDVNRIATQVNRSATEGVNAILMGVEVDTYLRPVAYHLRGAMQGDTYTASRATQTTQRVPADEIIHGFISDLPEQVRGVPWMHASMLRLNNLGGYEEAAVIASRVGASKMGFFSSDQGQSEVMGDGVDDATGHAVTEVAPGTFETLPAGTTFTPFDPDYPSAMFADFVKANLRGVASGLGVAYHSLANDLEGVSFSSIRSGTLEERDAWMVIQEWFKDAFLEPLYAEWLRNALAFGLITLPAKVGGKALPLSKLQKFSGHVFQPRRWEWVDPLRDIQADREAIEAGLKSPQDVAAGMGRNLEDVLTQIKAAQEMAARMGVAIDWLRLNKPGAAAGAAPAPAPASA